MYLSFTFQFGLQYLSFLEYQSSKIHVCPAKELTNNNINYFATDTYHLVFIKSKD